MLTMKSYLTRPAIHLPESEVLRLADGSTIRVTKKSWKNFLDRLCGNYLTNQSASTYSSRDAQGTSTRHGHMVQETA